MKCANCPVKGAACLGEGPHPEFCQWADRNDHILTEHIKVRAAGTAAPEQPALMTKAVNLGRAVVAHARVGFPSVDDATYNERLRVCEACPNLILPAWICGGPKGCGCNLKLKARWAEQKCPLAKWER